MRFVVSYLSTGIVLLAFDALWLGLMAGRLYRPQIGHLMADTVNVPPAVLFYLLYVVGVVVFAVQPAFVSGRWTTALGLGALLGLVAYGTYDLTNHATLRNWPALISLVDISWGIVLTALSATMGLLITRAVMGAGPT